MSIIFTKVRQNASRFPDKKAIQDSSGNHLTYSQLVELVETKIRNLQNIVAPGRTRVALCLNEGMEVPVTVLALNALDVPVIPLNPGLQPDQIRNFLDFVEADVVITEKATVHLLEGHKPGIETVDSSELNGAAKDAASVAFKTARSREYAQFLITLSSGSTGSPKPIVLSEANKLDRSEQAINLYGVTNRDIILCASPFYHSLGQRLTFLPLLAGATLVLLTRFTVQNWCKTVVEHGVTFTIPVSSHLHELVDALLVKPFQFASLRCLVSSSAAINDEVKKDLFDALPCDFHEMYGASEVATATSLNKKQAILKPGSVGVPCPGVEVRVVDERLVNCKLGDVGQIAVKSPLASSGYYKSPQVTKESFVDGYFLTGDLGYLDEDGYLFFVDRKKDVVISGGMNIYPSDIECVINETQSVKVCIVVGIRDPYLGEVPVAVVVAQGDARAIEKEIRANVHRKLAAYQRPLKYFFWEGLPLTASGKIDKRTLRDELNALSLDLSSKLRALQNTQGWQ